MLFLLGKNIPLDLDLEHDNNYLKEAMRKMGPAMNEQSVTRICRTLKISREVIENLLKECQVMKRSGIHFNACEDKDLLKLVNNLVHHGALNEEKGRKYKTFTDCLRSHLQLMRMSDLCKWINQHKEGIELGRKAQ